MCTESICPGSVGTTVTNKYHFNTGTQTNSTNKVNLETDFLGIKKGNESIKLHEMYQHFPSVIKISKQMKISKQIQVFLLTTNKIDIVTSLPKIYSLQTLCKIYLSLAFPFMSC